MRYHDTPWTYDHSVSSAISRGGYDRMGEEILYIPDLIRAHRNQYSGECRTGYRDGDFKSGTPSDDQLTISDDP